MAPVSVVVPCFRCAQTIRRAVSSALSQTLSVSEVILVDDCSGDGTWNELRALQREVGEHRLKLISLPENMGPGSARNAGWDVAAGQYVAFLDADDSWHSQKVEAQLVFMRKHPEYALTGHEHAWRRDAAPYEREISDFGFDPVPLSRLLLSNPLAPSAVMVKRSVPFRFSDRQRYMEDHLLWMQMVSGGLLAAKLRATLSYRFSRPFGATGLSARLWAMERAELTNYLAMHRSGAIGMRHLAALIPWSFTKFVRRIAITALHRATPNRSASRPLR